MTKRSSSGLSLVVGVDKPAGMTSHDVVDRCRRIYGERRVGHTGTLDPDATGALAICIGPATRLDQYLTGHDKEYEFTIVFGSSTDTDDAHGHVLRHATVPDEAYDPFFAQSFVESLVGDHLQMPPAYSAIKVNGTKSYDAARKGNIIELSPREITIYSANLIGMQADGTEAPVWQVRASVSAGTYIRSIARDVGAALDTCAHVGDLRRVRAGRLRISDCVSLDALQNDPFASLLDPVKLLGGRFIFADAQQSEDVSCGRLLSTSSLELFCYDARVDQDFAMCGCTSGVCRDKSELMSGEVVAIIVQNELKALYEYDAAKGALKSKCGFAVGVKRGSDIQS